ncbi:MAG: DUF4177 domain-containing protein [Pseudomonadota bacterium]
MVEFEYRVVPAPVKAKRVRGLKGKGAQFAHTVEEMMNELGADGWEYLRADTLPAEERQGLTSKTTVFQNMLVFRRQTASPSAREAISKPAAAPLALPAPARSHGKEHLKAAAPQQAANEATTPKKPAPARAAKAARSAVTSPPTLYTALATRAAQLRGSKAPAP